MHDLSFLDEAPGPTCYLDPQFRQKFLNGDDYLVLVCRACGRDKTSHGRLVGGWLHCPPKMAKTSSVWRLFDAVHAAVDAGPRDADFAGNAS